MLSRTILHHGYLFIFAGSALEGDATLLTASFLARRGHFSLPVVMLLAAIAATITDQVLYLLVWHRGHAFIDRLAAKDRRFARAEQWVATKGGVLLFLSRFILGFRTLIPVACAAAGMEAVRFFVINLTGAIVWSVVIGYLGYSGDHALRRFLRHIRLHEIPFAAAILLIALLSLAWYAQRRGSLRERNR